MALRLRRGTDAERQLITPVVGELIYTTDTKLLYVGDSSTAGGTLVSGVQDLSNLLDVDITGATDGQVLTYDTNTQKWIPDTLDSVIEGSNYRINVVGDDSSIMLDTSTNTFTGVFVGDGSGLTNVPGVSSIFDLNDVFRFTPQDVDDILQWDGFHWVPQRIRRIEGDDSSIMLDTSTNTFTGNFAGNVAGDVTGSVFGDDSTVLVDGVNSSIVGNIRNVNTVSQNVQLERVNNEPILKIISETNTGSFGIPVISINNNHTGTFGQEITFNRSNGTYAAPTSVISGDFSGSITIRAHDGNDYTTIGAMHVIADAVNGVDDIDSSILFLTRNGSIAGDYGTMLKLGKGAEVSGYVQFGSYTTTERDALTPAFGMVIYNTTTNVFEGYQNTSGTTPQWVALS